MATRKNRPDLLGKRGQMKRQERRGNRARDAKRKLLLETLEDRRLLAVGPQLIGIQPNDGELLPFDDPNHIRNTAPRELIFRFDENQAFDTNNLDGIQVTRANLDQAFAAATVQTDFNTGGAVTVEFEAAKLGEDQNGISLGFAKRDQGGSGLPTVNVVGNRIDITLNNNISFPTTAEQLIEALRLDEAANALVRATVNSGPADTPIAMPALSYSPLILSGADDVVVDPGYIGVGDLSNEIIVRFSETLPDDLYRIDVYGEGLNALRNTTGTAFNDLTDDNLDDGSDFSYQFELDLGARITSVIPQPVLRDGSGNLSQAQDKVLVYFNDDELLEESVENSRFYQLIFTNDNAEVFDANFDPADPAAEDTSDVVFYPSSVEYNSDTNAALLTFEADLDQLPDPRNAGAPIGHGTYRLRIGTDEAAPRNPAEVALGAAGDSFDTAIDLSDHWDTGRVIVINGDATLFQDEQWFIVTDNAGVSVTFEFDFDGVPTGNTDITLDPTDTEQIVANKIATQINNPLNTPNFNVNATVVQDLASRSWEVQLANDASIRLADGIVGLGLSTRGVIIKESVSVVD